MSWTYSGNPNSSAADAVRFLAGDTVEGEKWTLQDEEISYCLSEANQDAYLAAALVIDAMLPKIAVLAQSKSIGDLSVSWTSRHQQFSDRQKALRTRATLKSVPTTATGLSIAEKQVADADADRIAPVARVDGMKNPNGFDPSVDGN